MKQSLVITAIGADRPGIVNEFTEILLNADLNIEDSRMSVLGGEFVVMLLVTGNQAAIDSVNKEKDALSSSLGLNLLIKSTSPQDTDNEHVAYKITVEGMDNPGIVHKLARYLSQNSINIVNMQTDSGHAPHTGTPMFTVNMLVDIPSAQNMEQIETDFSALCDEMNMDAEFRPS